MVLRNAEVLRSQRLDHVSGSMIAVYEAQDSFVDGACDIEFSERILSNSHVREILMRSISRIADGTSGRRVSE